MEPTESPRAGIRRVTEACAPYDTPEVVNVYAIVARLSRGTLQDMAGMLALIHPRHFETLVMRDGARP